MTETRCLRHALFAIMTVAMVVGLSKAEDQQDIRPTFAAASIRRTAGPAQGALVLIPRYAGLRLLWPNVPVTLLIQYAFDRTPKEISGLERVPNNWYRIEATTSTPADQAAVRLMLQSLLEDRFRLLVHHENKRVAVYNLMPDSHGIKLQRTKAPPSDPNRMIVHSFAPNTTRATGRKATMKQMAEWLSRSIDRVVIDRTGITEEFDFDIDWLAADSPPDVLGIPSVFTALREQAGLRLEPGTALINTLVIDRVEAASDN